MANPAPIDRGWAWVITCAVFGSNILCVGYFRAFGVFFVEIIDTFQSSSSLTSLIMGIQSAVCCLTALVVHNVLLDRIEVRTCALFGGAVMAGGMALGMFAFNVPFLILTLSVLVGVGNAFTYGPGIVLLGQYFQQRRALANSLASMGASVGSMALPVLATFLLSQYGLRGGLLLYGAVTFHICVFASLYRPFPSSSRVSLSLSSRGGDDADEFQNSLLEKKGGKEKVAYIPDEKKLGSAGSGNHYKHVSIGSMPKTERDAQFPETLFAERVDISQVNPHTVSRKSVEGDPRQFSSTGDMFDPLAGGDVGLYDDRKRSLTFSDLRMQSSSSTRPQHLLKSSQQRLRLEGNTALRLSQPYLLIESSAMTSESRPDDVSEDSRDGEERVTLCGGQACDSQLLRMPMFWLVQCYVCVGVMGATGAGSYIPVLMQEKGLSKNDTALTLVVWGSFNLLGRLGSGLLADRRLLRPPTLSALSFAGIGVLFATVARLPHTLVAMGMFSALFGLLEGVYFSMLPDVIIGFVSLGNFSRTFGFAQLSQGAFAAGLYPVLGALKDMTGSYHATFYLLGICAFTASFLLVIVPVARIFKQNLSRR